MEGRPHYFCQNLNLHEQVRSNLLFFLILRPSRLISQSVRYKLLDIKPNDRTALFCCLPSSICVLCPDDVDTVNSVKRPEPATANPPGTHTKVSDITFVVNLLCICRALRHHHHRLVIQHSAGISNKDDLEIFFFLTDNGILPLHWRLEEASLTREPISKSNPIYMKICENLQIVSRYCRPKGQFSRVLVIVLGLEGAE